jgi:acetyl esterase/lipase
MNYLSEPKGGWHVPVSIDVSEAEKIIIESQIGDVFKKLGPDFDLPEFEITTVHGEWQGGEASKKEFNDGPIVLALHGGGYITGSPAMERSATFKLARMSASKIFAVDYRLAPQHPFPAALIDAVVAYKYLISPPPGALHDAIDPSRIVIAGDSSGVSPSKLF